MANGTEVEGQMEPVCLVTLMHSLAVSKLCNVLVMIRVVA
jgi:hypothetical protein